MTTSSAESARARSLPATPSMAALWTGRVLQGLAVAFLTFDVAIKISLSHQAIEGTVDLGYPSHSVLPIGLIGLACLVLYLIPRTAILGAVLWTGYFGGAIATHLRLANPLATHTLFPIYIAVLVWGGLWLRDERLRALLPLRRAKR
ncbi:DoxX family protein [Vulgatibacter incomptus]|uniref:Arginine/ornithine antiporter ArcD n=1 Tax=Vulgatibacter incomptus TaxID=1391653 RepID=A0A0K1PGN0_9BACT|nr:DoxX family protein [Vulgatibacter incomptus]AKU92576.1 Arginine/ornithine antiporter ArcD [Vulgatibacter incomptus]